MSISDLTFGNPTYDPVFTVSSGDEGVIRLRSKETAPLSHESLDENFTNLANKINEILGLKIGDLSIGNDGKIAFANLSASAGSGLNVSASGEFTHQARPTPVAGYSSADLGNSNRRFVNALDFDDFGHVIGYKTNTLDFEGTGSVSVDQSTFGKVIISSDSYSSGSSPSFGNITATGNIGLGTTSPSGGGISGKTLQIEDSAASILRLHRTTGQGATVQDYSLYAGSLAFAIHDNKEDQARLVIKDGKVGIGTTSPTARLDIVNTSTTTTESYGLSVQGGGNSTGSGYSLRALDQSGNVDFFVRGDGNVGIGTTNPDFKLTVDNGIGNEGLKVIAGNNGDSSESVFEAWNNKINGSDPDLLFKVRGDGYVGIGTASPASHLHVIGQGHFTRSSNQSAPLYAKQDGTGPSAYFMGGNVGIDTTSPSAKLTIEGTEAGTNLVANNHDASIKIRNTSDTDGNFASLDFYNSTNYITARIGANFIDAGNRDTALYFATRKNGGDLARQMIIDEDGNVGIGATSPDSKLHLEGATTADARVTLEQTTANLKAEIQQGSAGFALSAIGNQSLLLQTNGSERLRINQSGYVGIGTTSPDQILTSRPTQAGKYGIHVIKPATNDSLGGIFVETDSTTSLYLKDRSQNPQSTIRLKAKGDSYFTGGKVGVGTMSPSARLHVPQPSGTIGGSDLSKSAILVGSTTVGIGIDDNEIIKKGSDLIIGTADNNGITLKTNNNVNSTQVRLTSVGLGIGTSIPTKTLDVDGDINFTGNIYQNGSLFSGGGGSAFTGGEVTTNITIKNSNPVFVLKDTNGGDNNSQSGYISWRDNANTERGYVGFGSTSNKEFTVRNAIGELVYSSDSHVFYTANGGQVLYVSPNGDVEGKKQFRAKGWASSSATGTACEIGMSSDIGYLMAYDRTNSTYRELRLHASNAKIHLKTDGTVNMEDKLYVPTVYTGNSSPASNGWFRAYGDGGLYSQTHAQHFYATDGDWGLTFGSHDSGGLFFYEEGVGDGKHGSVFYNSTGFGMLNKDNYWVMRTDPSHGYTALYEAGVENMRVGPSGVSGSFGNILVKGGSKSGYYGISINNQTVLMQSTDVETVGLYNDVNNQWFFLGKKQGTTKMCYAGATKIETTNTGAKITGDLEVTGNLSTSGGDLPVAVVGSGTLTVGSDYHGHLGNITSAGNTHKYRYHKVGNMVTIHFELSRYHNWGLTSGGYVSFTGLPFTPKEYSGYANKAIGSYCQNSANHAHSRICTIQSGKLYIWGGAGLDAYNYSVVGTVTYET